MPEVVLREALLNAIAQKDYASGAPIQISVYDDKLILWNPGQLPPDWTLARLTEKHPSQPFNPDLANAFFRAGMIESWGRGIERVLNACREAGALRPEWRHEETGLWVVFTYPAAAPVEAPVKTPVEVLEQATPEVQGTAQKTTQKTTHKILQFLRAYPSAGRREIAAHLAGITEDGVKYHLNKLKAAGRIQRVGPAKGGHWEVLGGIDE